MEVNSSIVINIIVLILQVLISFTKYRKFGIVLVIASCIAFLVSKEEVIYDLALTQFMIYFVLLIVFEIKKSINNKKKGSI